MNDVYEESSDKADKVRFLGATNTQTRRLGYLVAILDILRDSYLPEEALVRRLIRWSENHAIELQSYTTNKGIVKTKSSAERYIDLADTMGIIGEINNYLRPTEIGRLIGLAHSDENLFFLRESSIYFHYQLFNLDADYLVPCLKLVRRYESQKKILKSGKGLLYEHLKDKLNDIKGERLDEARDRVEAVQSWKRPESYGEHIFVPRIHWLIDLGMVRLVEGSGRATAYSLTKLGKRIEKRSKSAQMNRFWCQNTLMRSWARSDEQRGLWEELPETGQRKIISILLKEAFRELRTSSHRRISASQFILYSTAKINYHLNISCGFDDVKAKLRQVEEQGDQSIDFYWSERKGSGYIVDS